ncbi:MAG TPA: tetratricopeptide repeat protein, partial [Pyrinomonadaceae bacterium]|nr:tetratricopeptide repeat protein [Pyrinomonadaceae bacterium]
MTQKSKIFTHIIGCITLSFLALITVNAQINEIKLLLPKKILESALAGGQTHKYKIEVKANEFLQVKVEQKGIDVVVKLFDNSGKKLAEMDSPNGTQGFENLLFIFRHAGVYTIEISSLEANAPKGNYAIVREAPRIATTEDQKQIEASKTLFKANLLVSEANALLSKNTPESMQAAAEKFELALPLFQEIGDKRNEGYTLFWLAQINNSAVRAKRALEFYNQALPLIKQSGDKRTESIIYNSAGMILAHLGENRKSLEYLKQALYLCESVCVNKEERAMILFGIGGVYQSLGEYQNALENLNSALPVIKAANYKAIEAIILGLLGTISSQQGDKQKALDYYNQSLLIHRAIGAKNFESAVLIGIGDIYRQLGEVDKALQYHSQALLIAKEIGDKGSESFALNNIGVAYQDLGEQEKALDYFNQSLLINKSLENKNNEAITLQNIGSAYENLGNFYKALDYYNQALIVFEATGDKSNEANTLMNIGSVYDLLNNEEKTLEYLQKALSIQRAIGDKSREAKTLANLAAFYAVEKNLHKVTEFSEKALSLTKQIGDRRSEALIFHNLGNFFYHYGDKQKSIDNFNKALAIRKAIGDKTGETHTLNNIGFIYTQSGENDKSFEYLSQALLLWKLLKHRYGEARTLGNLMVVSEKTVNPRFAIIYGKQSVNLLQSLRTDIKGLDKDLQKSFLGSVEGTYRKLAELLIREGRLPEAEQVLAMLKEEEYFALIRGGDNETVSQLNKRITLSQSEKEALKRYEKIADEITKFGDEYARLEKERLSLPDEQAKHIIARQEELNKQLDDARTALRLFLEALKKEFSREDKRVAAVEEGLQAAVKDWKSPDTVVISTIVGRENLSIIVTTSDIQRGHIIPIKEENLNKLVGDFRAKVLDKNSDPKPEAQKLYDVLIKPLETDLAGVKAKNLVWSLDGILRYAPIAALWDTEKGYLARRFSNSVITLASRQNLAFRPDGKKQWQALGVGVSKEIAGFKSLSFVPEELEAIVRDPSAAPQKDEKGVMEGRRFLNEKFTLETFRNQLGRYPVIHTATHFNFIPGTENQSLNSFLLLGSGEKLTLREIRDSGTIFNGVQLLTLSACDTAYGGKDADGREVEGFGALAQKKGAKAIMATLWRVNDESTRDLMVNFYENYQKDGISKAEALRQAQLSLIQDEKFAHPYYWSAFVL